MNLFLTQSPQIGAAKAYLLRQALSMAAKKANHTVVEQAKEADLVIVFGSSLANSAELVGKVDPKTITKSASLACSTTV